MDEMLGFPIPTVMLRDLLSFRRSSNVRRQNESAASAASKFSIIVEPPTSSSSFSSSSSSSSSSSALPFDDSFTIFAVEGVVQIRATSGVAAAAGVNHYLKTYCGCSVSWAGRQLKLPHVLPSVDPPVTVTFTGRPIRYI